MGILDNSTTTQLTVRRSHRSPLTIKEFINYCFNHCFCTLYFLNYFMVVVCGIFFLRFSRTYISL